MEEVKRKDWTKGTKARKYLVHADPWTTITLWGHKRILSLMNYFESVTC